jgi:hypothetical protein
MPNQTTDTSSLESAASRIAGLLSPSEDTQTPTTQPEQSPTTETEQAPAAPTEESAESEQVADEESETAPEQPQKFTAKVDGQDVEVTLEELLKGYSFTEHNTRKSQSIAAEKAALDAERKAFQESEVAKVREERSQYAQYLEQFKTALVALHPTEPDWTTLRSQVSADEFAAELLSWQQTQKRIETTTKEQAKVADQQQQDAEAGFRTYLQQERALLEEALPEIKDPVKDAALAKDLREYAVAQGFTEQEFKATTNHRMLVLAHKAMLYDRSKAEKPKIENKIANALASSAPGSRTTAPPKNDLTVARAALKKSGSEDDAAAAITALITRKR